MATKQQQSAPTPTRPRSTNGVIKGTKAGTGDERIVVIVFGQGQDKIVPVFADVLGKPYRMATNFSSVRNEDHGTVIGIAAGDAKVDIDSRNRSLIVAINAHCVALGMPPDLNLSASTDYEFLYTETPFFRRDLSRFISFILGQISHHEALITKPRTYFISTTFPDVRTALSNLDILSVGSDAVEIRVDLLKEGLTDGTFNSVPSLSYVGEQVMLLRQRTELPIIFTTRCTKENGRFPMDNPELYYEYLYRAIQWGCEYVDVEVWLPEDIRRRLFEQRGNSKIISAFHDFSGTFKWPSIQAQNIFQESRKYGDIVKMITIINTMSENYELEYFRSQIKANNPDGPPLSAVNMGQLGQLSRALNTVFSPITHPLLPIVAAPGQLSAAEINGALATMGQLPKKNIYAIAYKDRAAIILSSNGEDAASVIFALRSLNIGKIYTVGFKAHGPLATGVEPFTSVESVTKSDTPFVIISALPPEKTHLVQPLLRYFSNGRDSRGQGKVFVDLANGPRKGDPIGVAEGCGWTAYGVADTTAFTTVETLRLLVGQNVPYSFRARTSKNEQDVVDETGMRMVQLVRPWLFAFQGVKS
ncbi:hypothetical protein SS1G_04843 [Sclerotinia sclerotiorum 1980 UF-70]|uniref:3-dehydroquinate dehydratase n=1 Tax=Sclerotinia sclerotiorum (strain ATCC 18683 / 1980 / Ss-1) TaxID=665079 RepID=A7EHQ1_SCLS1|nr:hypothetical protein SS1G_04843 [Sclerotinia sclerotiorum 1980 UF-70]EDO02367.1 hypothetical protein SS1G_04843 [Sclerotinia sclerotiorum 1980 UF-70]